MEETRAKEEDRVSRMLGSLPAAEAPDNFEGMVRSRIADRRRSDAVGRPIFWLAVKFAAPMLLLMFLGVFFVISNDRPVSVGSVPPVDAPGVASANLGIEAPSNTVTLNAGNSPQQSRSTDRRVQQRETGQPAEEMALSRDDTTLFPPGVDPRRVVPKNQKPPAGGQISATEILGMLGITTSCSDAGCRIVSIQPNSVAHKVGLEHGDVIEAIDDRQIRSGSRFEGSMSISSLRIVRSGKRSIIAITSR